MLRGATGDSVCLVSVFFRRMFRNLGVALAALVLLLLLTITVGIRIDLERLRGPLEALASRSLAREVRLSGCWPRPSSGRVYASGIRRELGEISGPGGSRCHSPIGGTHDRLAESEEQA